MVRIFLMDTSSMHAANDDPDIPYPSPADRKDLENLVKSNWDSKVQKPLGYAADQSTDQWHHAKEWIFDT
jgi:hypothetical protein